MVTVPRRGSPCGRPSSRATFSPTDAVVSEKGDHDVPWQVSALTPRLYTPSLRAKCEKSARRRPAIRHRVAASGQRNLHHFPSLPFRVYNLATVRCSHLYVAYFPAQKAPVFTPLSMVHYAWIAKKLDGRQEGCLGRKK